MWCGMWARGLQEGEGEESRMSLRVWPEQLEEESYHLLRLGEVQKFANLGEDQEFIFRHVKFGMLNRHLSRDVKYAREFGFLSSRERFGLKQYL